MHPYALPSSAPTVTSLRDTARQTASPSKDAKVVKVNPDTPQKMVRYHVLETGKTLLTPQPRLRTGFFSTLHKDDIPPVCAGAYLYGGLCWCHACFPVVLIRGGTTHCPFLCLSAQRLVGFPAQICRLHGALRKY